MNTPIRIMMLSSCLALGAAVFAFDANAQGTYGQPMPQGGMMQGAGMSHMKGMMGMHKMPATVTSVDTKTGLLNVTSAGMNLTLHFPPTALADVKTGDSITIQMAFSKP